MNFTDYYSRILAIQGQQPNLNFEQHKKMFNIISLEMRLEEIKNIESKLTDPGLQRIVMTRQQAIRSQLEKLTQLDHAASLLGKMIEASRD